MRFGNNKLKGAFKSFFVIDIIVTVALALATIGIYFISVLSGIIMSAVLLISVITIFIVYIVQKTSINDSLLAFASGYAQLQKQMLDSLLVPYGILDEQGRLIWADSELTSIVGEDALHKEIGSYFEELSEFYNKRIVDSLDFDSKLDDRDYHLIVQKICMDNVDPVITENVLNGDENIYVLYAFDDTELKTCKQELIDEKFVAGLIYIDNYDEALESIDEVRRSLLIALVERKISKYVAQGNGILKKLEKDKFLVVFRYKFLEQLRNDKFTVLEDVKSVNIGNEMSVTISIGIGAMNGSYEANYEMARTAIDLALGRGGDQAVIKEGKTVTYFGGKTNSIEKNTRVRARVKAHALRELLEGADNVLIMGHKISDVDALGAAAGIFAAARIFDKKANIVLNEITTSLKPVVDMYNNSAEYDKDLFVKSEDALTMVSQNTLLVIVDVNRRDYTECPELIGKCKNVVVIDHHRLGSDPVENATLSYIEPYASSASEMVAEILQYINDKIKIKPVEADTLYAGILIDTNNFTTKAGARTFEAAAFIRRSGADIVRVRKILRSDMSEYKAKAETVRRAEVLHDCYALSVCPSAGLHSPTVVGAQAANDLLDISGMKASFVLTFHNNEIYISARSIDDVNVQVVMERLGGGGHMSIAGAQLKDMDLEQAYELVKKTIEDMIKEGIL